MRSKCTFFIMCVFLISCKSPLQFFQDYSGKKLIIGSGGGFTGAYNEYSLLGNGYVFSINSLTKDTSYIGNFEKAEAEQFFNNFEILGFENMKINHPGNMNYFIKLENKDKLSELLWYDGNKVDDNVKLYYSNFMEKIRKLKEKDE